MNDDKKIHFTVRRAIGLAVSCLLGITIAAVGFKKVHPYADIDMIIMMSIIALIGVGLTIFLTLKFRF